MSEGFENTIIFNYGQIIYSLDLPEMPGNQIHTKGIQTIYQFYIQKKQQAFACCF